MYIDRAAFCLPTYSTWANNSLWTAAATSLNIATDNLGPRARRSALSLSPLIWTRAATTMLVVRPYQARQARLVYFSSLGVRFWCRISVGRGFRHESDPPSGSPLPIGQGSALKMSQLLGACTTLLFPASRECLLWPVFVTLPPEHGIVSFRLLDEVMSTMAKLCLAGSVSVSAGIVFYVHYRQEAERTQLHEGVIKDLERQRMRQIENITILQKQRDLEKQLSQND